MDDVDDDFSYIVSSEINEEIDDPERKFVYECQNRHDWKKWNHAI